MPKRLPYHAGTKGQNRGRAYRHATDGKLYLEWWESGRRKSLKLSEDIQARPRAEAEDEAVTRAVALAEDLAEIDKVERSSQPLTLTGLFDIYGRERTPLKSRGKQKHDRRATRAWLAFFNTQPEASRRADRHPSTLDSVDWSRFISWRRGGRVPGFPNRVRNQSIRYDLQFLVATLNWALGVVQDGEPLLKANPWSGEIRKARRWGAMPKEENPHRPSMSDDLRATLLEHSPHWQFEVALRLGRETGRRTSAIRRLRWSDVDQFRWEVRWRSETDKTGRESVVPLSPKAIEILRELPSRSLGDAPLFPSAKDPNLPTPRDTFQVWLTRAKERAIRAASVEARTCLKARLRGVGYHAEKRALVRDPSFRLKPPKIQEKFVGTSHETLRKVYDEVTPDDLRAGMGFPDPTTPEHEIDPNRESEPRVNTRVG